MHIETYVHKINCNDHSTEGMSEEIERYVRVTTGKPPHLVRHASIPDKSHRRPCDLFILGLAGPYFDREGVATTSQTLASLRQHIGNSPSILLVLWNELTSDVAIRSLQQILGATKWHTRRQFVATRDPMRDFIPQPPVDEKLLQWVIASPLAHQIRTHLETGRPASLSALTDRATGGSQSSLIDLAYQRE